MFATLNSFQDQYIRTFPTEVPIKAAQGFMATVAIGIICGTSANAAVAAGVAAVAITVFEAMLRPITRAVFSDHPLAGMWIHIALAFGLPTLLIPGLYQARNGLNGLHALFSIIGSLALNDRWYARNVGLVGIL